MVSRIYGSSVPYEEMDPFKVAAQEAARATAKFLRRFGFRELRWTRGESVYLIETPFGILGFVVEGLGTKNLVADALHQLAIAQDLRAKSGLSLLGNVAWCNGAMVFNDIITLGVLPMVFGMHLAVGHGDWFKDPLLGKEVIQGTKESCIEARCTWGPGETPTLKGIIFPGTEELSGASVGYSRYKDNIYNPNRIRHGDAIVIIGSSGIHANGLTLAREIAADLPQGYETTLSDGRMFGEALLDRTHIYVKLIEACQQRAIPIRYTVNITGHGWRKLMRAARDFTYVIHQLPEPQPVFRFIQEKGPVETREMYGNYNMGGGFAMFLHPEHVTELILTANQLGFPAIHGGQIVRGERRVVLEPIGEEYKKETLIVR